MSCKSLQPHSKMDENNTISKDSIQCQIDSDLREIAYALGESQVNSDSDDNDDEDIENDIHLSIDNEKRDWSLACHVCKHSVLDFDELEYHMGKAHDNMHLKSKVCQ